jgi:hypothetical protein
LYLSPFNLILGDSIDAIVVASNVYGDSDASVVGSGGNIVYVPDKPINFKDDPLITTANQIGMSWDDGASAGG